MLLDDQNHIPILVLSGIVGHVLFNRLEPRGATAIVSLLAGPPTILVFLPRASYSSMLSTLILPYIVYLGTLVCSVVAYRLSPFHPLANFSGPKVCRISRLWAWYIVWTGKQHTYYQSLHVRYGTHVRTGPNHIHICDAEAIPTVLGAQGFKRGERYEVTKLHGTTGNLQTLLDKREHAQRRRVWDRGLNTSAVLGYQGMLAIRINQLLGALEKQKRLVNLSSWLSCFSFDFMGDLAFGGTFRMVEQGGDVDGFIRAVGIASRHQELVGTIPWIKPWHHLLPSAGDLGRFRKFATESVLARKANGSATKDIFYYLLDEEGVGAGPPSLPQLISESGLVIGAGSDTTGTSLSNLFFYLLSNPKSLRRLQLEVDIAFPAGSEPFDPTVAADMKFLNAVINETLRLQPAVPSGVQRTVPPGGAIIAGRWVAGATTVQVPTYSTHRDSRYFSPEPNSFHPERWLDSPQGDYRTQPSAFIPFSHGPMNCAGKYLALQELRLVVCALLQKFEFEFPSGWDVNGWEKGLSDAFILLKGDLPVHIKARA